MRRILVRGHRRLLLDGTLNPAGCIRPAVARADVIIVAISAASIGIIAESGH